MIKLYGTGVSYNVNKVRYCLNYLGLNYEWVQTNPMQGETRTAAFLAISPTGKIPAIEIDGVNLFESNAINRYLAQTHNADIYPADPKERAIVDAWMDYVSIHVGQAMSRVLFNRLLAPMIGQPVDPVSLQAGLDFLNTYFPILDKQLSGQSHLAGSSFTLADMNLLAVLDSCELLQIDLKPYPHIMQWREGLKKQSFYQTCYQDFTQYVQDTINAMKS